MELQTRLEELIEPMVVDMGYDLVRVRMTGAQRQTLQIMAERQDGQAMGVEDCADISRATSALLDVEDPIPGAYTLEVSSPGLDRPLVRENDFVRFAGFEAKVEMAQAIEGQKRFRGRVKAEGNGTVTLEGDDGVHDLPFAGIRAAKLVLTDDLIEAARDGRLTTG